MPLRQLPKQAFFFKFFRLPDFFFYQGEESHPSGKPSRKFLEHQRHWFGVTNTNQNHPTLSHIKPKFATQTVFYHTCVFQCAFSPMTFDLDSIKYPSKAAGTSHQSALMSRGKQCNRPNWGGAGQSDWNSGDILLTPFWVTNIIRIIQTGSY